MKRLGLIVLLLVAASSSGCALTDLLNPCPDDQVCVNGRVQYFQGEGGFWAIRGDDDVTYDPVDGVPADFRQANLRVHLRACVRSDVGSFHMAGPMVEIIDIRRLQ
jgi:hypothetical protein